MDSFESESPRELTDALAARLAVLSAGVVFPPRREETDRPPATIFVRMASWWGRTTHEIPVRYARELAVARSESADEPAMLTMLFGMGLVFASYAIHLAVVGLLTRSFLISAVYLAALVTGAYWTAFEAHRR